MGCEARFLGSRRFRLASIALAALGFCLASFSAAVAQEMRMWTDVTGQFKVKAKFVSFSSDGKVTLEREDGKVVAVPMQKLSADDRIAVGREMQEKAKKGENPFQPVEPARRSIHRRRHSESSAESDQSSPDDGSSGEPDWSGVKEVLVSPIGSKWSVPVDAPPSAAERTGRPVPLPTKVDPAERAVSLAINPVCRHAVIGLVKNKSASSDTGQTRLLLCDLDKGALLAAVTEPGLMVPLGLDDTGINVLMGSSQFSGDNRNRLDVWRLNEKGISKHLSWTPYGNEQHHGGDLRWAGYLEGTKLATLSNNGRLAVWDAFAGKPLYWLQILASCRPALSPTRKYLAFATRSYLGILNVASGEVIGLQAGPQKHPASLTFAFTPKGTRLVADSMEQLFVWDVATGALFREISLQGRGGLSLPNLASISGDEMHGSLVLNIRSPDERSLICLSEELVLAADHLLVDVESEAKLWAYVGHEVVGSLGRVCWFAVLAPDESGALLPAILPQPSAKAKIQKALDAPDFFVLKPGATVKLNVSGLPDPAEREKIAAALTQKLQANGCQIGPNGTVELVAATELGKHRDLGYRSIGPPNGKAYSFQEYISRVKIVWQGQTAWEATTTNAPGFFVRLKEGQTMQQYLQEKEHPNYAWLATVDLPRVLQKPTAGGATLGTTQVTAAGLQ